MIKRPWLVLVAIPCIVNLIMVGLYFSEIEWMQNLMVPQLEQEWLDRQEFGLLANIQNIYLLVMAGIGAIAVVRKPYLLEKAAGIGLFVFAIFIFLEEIDYGLHWKEFINNTPPEDVVEVRNWHNVGERTSIMKDVVTGTTVLIFVVAPLALRRNTSQVVRYLLPSIHYLYAFIGIVLISRLAHYLNDLNMGPPGVSKNVGEFRELGMYYMYMLWTWTIVFRRDYDNPPGTDETAG